MLRWILGQLRRHIRPALAIGLVALALVAGAGRSGSAALAAGRAQTSVRLPGHVLPALAKATRVAATSRAANAESQPLALTVVLNRRDEPGFQKYLADVENPLSPNHLHFLTQALLTQRFGPSQKAYDAVLAWLTQQGLTLSEGSANHLTLTVKGTRAQAEKAFQVNIGDYQLGSRSFYATDQDPAVPASVASDIQAITGLSNLAQPQRPTPNSQAIGATPEEKCLVDLAGPPNDHETASIVLEALDEDLLAAPIKILAVDDTIGACLASIELRRIICLSVTYDNPAANCEPSGEPGGAAASRTGGPAAGSTGAGQKVGLLEFDTFHASDVSNWLQFVSANIPSNVSPGGASQVSEVNVNGGVATPGAGEAEVLLDIDAILGVATGANVAVYDAPGSASFQAEFQAMLNDPAGPPSVISNSWSYCEDETSLADVQSLDTILASAAASGISVFNGSGDSGSACLDGSPNTVGVPADSPNATAVGGTSVTPDTAFTYGSESWWDGSQSTPQTGQGGFGVSKFFSRPSYQTSLTTATMRSVPDVAANADPLDGFQICQADAGGCPDGLFHGGTSLSAPEWAAVGALLNQARGQNLGLLNQSIYPLANTGGFHSATSMGSDFAHVGLGSPNFDALSLALRGATVGPVSTTVSTLVALPTFIAADGTTQATLLVQLLDANGSPVSGKSVSITAPSSSHAIISPTSGTSSPNNGAVQFTVTDSTIEPVTFTATDTSDSPPNGLQLTQTATVNFVSPPATGGRVDANPTSEPADGSSASTITVTLQNAQGQGASGKTVALSQGNGQSHITATGPTPGVTDQNGQATFSAADLATETVTYTATDVTDGNLPVPVTATVDFTNGSASSCINTPVPSAGYALNTFASGFAATSVFAGCFGPVGLAFDSAGNLLVLDHQDGHLYKFGPSGGVADASTQVGTTALPDLIGLAFGKDGRLYAAVRGSNEIVELDPTTGAILRTVTTAVCEPMGLAIDPLTGDLFAGQQAYGACAGGISRIANPGSATPSVSLYTSMSGGSADGLAFGPDGTLFAAVDINFTDSVAQIDGTNTPTPGVFSLLASGLTADGIAVGIAASNPGQAAYLLVNGNNGTLTKLDLSTTPPTPTDVFTGGSRGDLVAVGPDGCIYADQTDQVLKLTNAGGSCSLPPSGVLPEISLSPTSISPNPGTGASETFTASLHNVSNPQGTNLTFTVSGANPQTQLVQADANGVASFSYTGARTGGDTIVATASVPAPSGSGTVTVTSNPASVTWGTGKQVTFLNLNTSVKGGATGSPTTLTANLTATPTDPTQTAPVPVSGQPVTIGVAGQSCQGTSDSSGTATCQITVTEPDGSYPLTATYAGSSNYTGSTATDSFVVGTRCGQGDVNCDSVVNATDALCILRFVAKLPGTLACPMPPPGNTDLNGDGKTDSTDALCDLRHIANLPSTGACPAWGSQPPGTATEGTGNRGQGTGMAPASSPVSSSPPSFPGKGAGELGAAHLILQPAEVSAAAGRRTTVALTFDAGGAALGSWTLDIIYDPKAVKVVNCDAAAGGICNADYAPGVVRIVGASAGGLSGGLMLATLEFDRIGGTRASSLSVTAVTLADLEGATLTTNSGASPPSGR